MDCPSCKQPQPENNTTGVCSYCGDGLPRTTLAAPVGSPPFKLKWRWFWVGLLAPPILTTLSAFLASQGSSASNEGVSVAIGFIGSGIGAFVCALVLGTQLTKDLGIRILLTFVFMAMMGVVCLTLSCFGCGIGGYHMDFK
jgi:hypothetical protein